MASIPTGNCPSEFYENCRNAIKKCKYCRANNRSYPLQYDPYQDIGPHPAASVSQTKSKQVKQALRQEHQTVKQLIRTTIKSGAIYHDGDIKLANLRLEHKTRYRTGGAITVTKRERDKGRQQQIDGWVIKEHDGETFYVLTEKAFQHLISHTPYQPNLSKSNS